MPLPNPIGSGASLPYDYAKERTPGKMVETCAYCDQPATHGRSCLACYEEDMEAYAIERGEWGEDADDYV